jgi:uncharacterized protein (DUF427 family)
MNSHSSAWLEHPNYQIEIKPVDKRMVIEIDNVVILDTTQSLLLNEQGHKPVYYFPREDIQMDYLNIINKETFCPFKGKATHWALDLNTQKFGIAAWNYEKPFEQVCEIKNHIAFYPDVMKHLKFIKT